MTLLVVCQEFNGESILSDYCIVCKGSSFGNFVYFLTDHPSHNQLHFFITDIQQTSATLPAIPSASQIVGKESQSSSELPANLHPVSSSKGVAGELCFS